MGALNGLAYLIATIEGRCSPIYYDDEVIGFGLQVRDNGRKTFTLDYTFEGRRRGYFIGDHPDSGGCGRSRSVMRAGGRFRT
jgi:hypothetical protein